MLGAVSVMNILFSCGPRLTGRFEVKVVTDGQSVRVGLYKLGCAVGAGPTAPL